MLFKKLTTPLKCVINFNYTYLILIVVNALTGTNFFVVRNMKDKSHIGTHYNYS